MKTFEDYKFFPVFGDAPEETFIDWRKTIREDFPENFNEEYVVQASFAAGFFYGNEEEKKKHEHKLKNIEQASSMKIAILERQLSDAKKEFDACHLTKNILRDSYEKLEGQLSDAEAIVKIKTALNEALETSGNRVISDLKARLKDAEEVIAFYAEFDNWSEADGNNNVYDQIREDHSINGCGCNPICQCPKAGGKRARDYQKKYSNTNIQPKEAE